MILINFALKIESSRPPCSILFWFMSNAFLQRPISSKYWLLHPFSTRKPLAKAVPSKDYFTHLRTLKNTRKGCWVITPDYRTSHPRRFWAICDDSRSKIWHPLGLTLRHRRMPYGRVMLRILLDWFHSKECLHYHFEQIARNPTINLIHAFRNPLGIPYLSCTAKLSRAYVMQKSVSSRIFVSKKSMICICPMDVCTRNLRKKVESVLLWEIHTCCAWNMGAHVWRTTS